MTIAGAGQRGLVLHRKAEVASGTPEAGYRRPLAGVVPYACRNDAVASCNSRHLAQTRNRVGHEVNDELRERGVELAVLERQRLRWSAADVGVGVPCLRGGDKWLGWIDGRDRLGSEPRDELGGERAGPASDVQRAIARRQAREIRELRSQLP